MSEIENSIYNFKIALEKNNPDYIMRGDCQIALEALKEKAEREKGCWYCNSDYVLIGDGIKYCINCGKCLRRTSGDE